MDRPQLPRPAARRPDDSVHAQLALSHGAVSWHALPPAVRERAVALWIELLHAHRPGPPTGEDSP